MDMRKVVVGVLAVLVAAMAVTAVHVYDDVLFTEKDLESEESMWNLYERWHDVYTPSPNLG
ncbi:hypothetical protein ABZP36_022792 [Zizania latifolia]